MKKEKTIKPKKVKATALEVLPKAVQPLPFCENTIKFKQSIEVGFLDLAARLKSIRDKHLFDGRWETFNDYLADPKMNLDKGIASKLITIYERFILEYQVAPEKLVPIGYSKVYEILPAIKNKKDALEWLQTASETSRADLKILLREKESGVEQMKCDHPKSFGYVVVFHGCRKCGSEHMVSKEDMK